MKAKLLVIMPNLPDPKREENGYLYGLFSSLSKNAHVTILLIHNMFVKDADIDEVKKMGASVLFLRDIMRDKHKKWGRIIKEYVSSSGFTSVMFNSFYTAKYYMSHLRELDASVIVDAVRTQLTLDINAAGRSTDEIYRIISERNRERYYWLELPAYSNADCILVSTRRVADELGGILPEKKMIVLDGEDGTESVVAGLLTNGKRREICDVSRCVDVIRVGGDTREEYGNNGGNNSNGSIERYNEALKNIKKEYGLIYVEGNEYPNDCVRTMLRCAQDVPRAALIVPANSREIGMSFRGSEIEGFYEAHRKVNSCTWGKVNGNDYHCVLIKRSVVESEGTLDTNYATLEYAFDDYLFRMKQGGNWAIKLNEAFVQVNAEENGRLNDVLKDKKLLLDKWGESGTKAISFA
ncbi:MAG: hypothetical protein JW803_07950 [Endomicrobiales bacterium]|nr:hypothetical protein [Endomicrobiales bacterium]